MADINDIAQIIAEHCAKVDGINGAFYPFPNALERADCPAVVVELVNADVEHTTGDQKWDAQIRIMILEPQVVDTPVEFGIVNRLSTKVGDAFFTDPDGKGVRRVVPELRRMASRVLATRYEWSQQVTYGTKYACASVFLDVKFHRQPGS